MTLKKSFFLRLFKALVILLHFLNCESELRTYHQHGPTMLQASASKVFHFSDHQSAPQELHVSFPQVQINQPSTPPHIHVENDPKLSIERIIRTKQGASSLAFVFDTTGSMYPELVQAIDGAAKILATVASRPTNPIQNYVLVPFKDPEVGPVKVTNDPDKFQSMLRDLYVQGGGDCPEMSITAIKAALEKCSPNSFIYVFTDASAKDYKLSDEVLALIQEKQSQVVFLLTGTCNGYEDEGYKVYERIAAASSGQVFNLLKPQVKLVLDFVRDSLQAEKVNLATVVMKHGGTFKIEIPIDKQLKEITISVSGENPQVHAITSSGKRLSAIKGFRVLLNLKRAIILRAKHPEPGNWRIVVSCSSKATIRITGLSRLDFYYGFSVYPTHNIYQTFSRPIKDHQNHLLIGTYESKTLRKITEVQFVGFQNEILFKSSVTPRNLLYQLSKILLPKHNFFIKIVGIDNKGYRFIRSTNIALTAIKGPPPQASIFPQRQVAYRTQPFVLKCSVKSFLPFQLLWYHNHKPLKHALNYKHSIVGEFKIREVKQSDAGHYSCKAISSAGSSTASGELLIREPPPKLLPTRTIYALLGKQIIFKSPLMSKGSYKFEWFREKPGSLHLEHIKSEHKILHDGSLLLNHVTLDMLGVYVCVVSNLGTQGSSKVILKQFEKPSFNKANLFLKVKVHETVNLICKPSAGLPKPSIKWTKNGNFIQNGEHLVLRSVSVSSGGSYACVASNVAGSATQITKVVVIAGPVIKQTRSQYDVEVGHPIELPCEAHGSPRPRITWNKNGRPISFFDKNVSLKNNGGLFIRAARLEHAGTYVCIASNEIGSTHKKILLKVIQKPSFISGTTILNVKVHQNVNLVCKPSTGIPRPSIKWMINGKFIISGENLVLRRVSLSDSGDYVCIASNQAGSATQVYRVVVKDGPVIKQKKSQYDVEVGHPIELPCEAHGSPRPRITWNKNGKQISFTDKNISFKNNGGLFIRAAKLEHAGTYVCIASNEVGSTHINILLKVKQTKISFDHVTKVKVFLGQQAILPCKVQSLVKIGIEWLKDKKRIYPEKNVFINHDNALVFNHVTYQDAGIYECLASNQFVKATKIVELIVTQNPSSYPKTEPNEPVVIAVVEKQPAELRCDCGSNNYSPVIVMWKKNEQLLHFDPWNNCILGTNICLNPHTGSLMIPMSHSSHQGVYSCYAKTTTKVLLSTVQFEVHVPPKINYFNVQVDRRGQFVVNCEATGHPFPQINWFKENIPIQTNYQQNNFIYPAFSTYHQSNPLVSQFSIVCIARNLAGMDRKTYTFDSKLHPFFTDGRKNNLVVKTRKSHITLNCPVFGIPKPVVRWYKNGEGVPHFDKTSKIDYQKNTLTIPRSYLEKYTVYECRASNEIGSICRKFMITKSVSPKVTKKQTSYIKVFEHKPLTLNCDISGFPRPKVTWFKDGHKIDDNVHHYYEFENDGSILNIKNVAKSDRGVYVCKAVNEIGSTNKHFIVTVLVQIVIDRRNTNTHVFVPLNKKLKLVCLIASGKTIYSKIKWKKDGKEIVQGFFRRHVSFRGPLKNTLEIASATLNDHGRYTCEVLNEYSSDVIDIDVSIYDPPKILNNRMERITVKEGSNYALICKATGYPRATITWSHNHKSLDHNGYYQIKENGAVLEILQAKKEIHTGTYSCFARNKYGGATKEYLVNVQEKIHMDRNFYIKEVSVIKGQQIKLVCRIPPGLYGKYSIVWYKNDQKVSYYRNRNIKISGVHKEIMVINSASMRDKAKYSCVGSNSFSHDRLDFLVNVLVPAKINERTSTSSFIKGSLRKSFTFFCDAHGVPSPTIKWFFNNEPIEFVYHHFFTLSTDRRRLSIEHLRTRHQGVYTCQARNQAGSDQKNFNLQLNVPAQIHNQNQVSIIKAIKGTNVNLICQAHGVPFPKITWYDSRHRRLTKKRRIHDRTDQLAIEKVEVKDSGIYLCEAVNFDGRATKKFQLIVLVPPIIDEANLVANPKVGLGRLAILECPASGYPTPTVSWTFNGQPFTFFHSLGVNLKENSKILEIKKVTRRNEGHYTCTVQNEAGVVKKTINLKVLIPVTIENSDKISNINGNVGAQVAITCNARGEPTPSYMWLKDKVPISDIEDSTFEEHQNGKTLVIKKLQETDAGSYTCLASNPAGQKRKKFILSVYVPVSISSSRTNTKISLHEGAPLELECEARGSPEPSISWYKDSTKINPHSLSSKYSISRDHRIFSIISTSRFDSGIYKCEAIGKSGRALKVYSVKVHK